MKYLFIFIAFVVILAWCPWLSKEESLAIVDARVAEMRASNPDLCAMSIDKDSIQKVAFGYREKVFYDCTSTDTVYGISKSSDNVLITFYKGLLGMPKPIVQKSP